MSESRPPTQLTTECCGVSIDVDRRYCPKCGIEARINNIPPAASRPPDDTPPTCKECGCTTGGGEYCYEHKPYTVTPLKDGSFRSDRYGRRRYWIDDLAVQTPAPVAPDDTPTRLPSEQVIEIDEDGNVHYPDELTELRAEVSRLRSRIKELEAERIDNQPKTYRAIQERQ